jgi:hypothetical protein
MQHRRVRIKSPILGDIVDRLALDLFREVSMLSRTATPGRLHAERAGP